MVNILVNTLQVEIKQNLTGVHLIKLIFHFWHSNDNFGVLNTNFGAFNVSCRGPSSGRLLHSRYNVAAALLILLPSIFADLAVLTILTFRY